MSSTAATPASTRGASRCKVTQIAPGARNPLHLISDDGGDVWGWVECENVSRAEASAIVIMYGGCGFDAPASFGC